MNPLSKSKYAKALKKRKKVYQDKLAKRAGKTVRQASKGQLKKKLVRVEEFPKAYKAHVDETNTERANQNNKK